jgi:hypothetical protein
MTYTQKQVMPVLRKNPQSSLWNYDVRKWNDNQKNQYEFLRTGIKPAKISPLRIDKVVRRIIRVSDNKEYPSIKDCAFENKVVYATMCRKINKGITFKYAV